MIARPRRHACEHLVLLRTMGCKPCTRGSPIVLPRFAARASAREAERSPVFAQVLRAHRDLAQPWRPRGPLQHSGFSWEPSGTCRQWHVACTSWPCAEAAFELAAQARSPYEEMLSDVALANGKVGPGGGHRDLLCRQQRALSASAPSDLARSRSSAIRGRPPGVRVTRPLVGAGSERDEAHRSAVRGGARR